MNHSRISVAVLVVLLASAGVSVVRFATTGHAATGGGENGCEDVTGSLVPGQRGMTAVTSTSSPNMPIGSKVRISASDRDRPANSRSVVVTVTGAQQLPANVCLDLSPEAFRIFDPQGAAYRDADVEVVSPGSVDSRGSADPATDPATDTGSTGDEPGAVTKPPSGAKAGTEGCEDVTGSLVPGQRGMTAVTSTSSPNMPIGSKVRISASDRDRPANSRSVVVTVTGAQQLPANVCLDLSPEAFRIFDPQGAAYRDADVEVVAGG